MNYDAPGGGIIHGDFSFVETTLTMTMKVTMVITILPITVTTTMASPCWVMTLMMILLIMMADQLILPPTIYDIDCFITTVHSAWANNDISARDADVEDVAAAAAETMATMSGVTSCPPSASC